MLACLALLMDNYSVAMSSVGDCDGAGIMGPAAAATTHVFLLFIAVILLLMLVWLWLSIKLPHFSDAIPPIRV
jgi:hypothetical protein